MNLLPHIDVAFCVRIVATLGHFLWQAIDDDVEKTAHRSPQGK